MLPCTYVESVLAQHAAPCLAGIKPANPVAFTSSDLQWYDTYNALLNVQGISFTSLCVGKNHVQILVYRRALLTQICFERPVMQVLQQFGYEPDKGFNAILQVLKQRMESLAQHQDKCYKDIFPHAIGLLLGYPIEDVVQYVKTGGRDCLFCGYWKVYSNPDKARQIFHQYTECKERFALQIKHGMTLSQIVRAA